MTTHCTEGIDLSNLEIEIRVEEKFKLSRLERAKKLVRNYKGKGGYNKYYVGTAMVDDPVDDEAIKRAMLNRIRQDYPDKSVPTKVVAIQIERGREMKDIETACIGCYRSDPKYKEKCLNKKDASGLQQDNFNEIHVLYLRLW